MTNAYLSKSFQEFINASADELLGKINNSEKLFSVRPTQNYAWQIQVEHLQSQLQKFPEGRVLFEFSIPRMGKRADIILLVSNVVFVLEYKVGADSYYGADRDQTVDYALDLKNFHEPSHRVRVVPILISTNAPNSEFTLQFSDDMVAKLICSNGDNLAEIIVAATRGAKEGKIEAALWESGRYSPTPTIVQAAQALYRGHSVEDISRNEAGAENLSVTSNYVFDVIENAKSNNTKAICFITGVPGSGKTLAGLNIATQVSLDASLRAPAVFLSGNGPLVKVLREALVLDEIETAKERGLKPPTKSESRRKSATFIQNIHSWRDAYLTDETAPIDKIVVFDEAQRAWTTKQTSNFMKQKKGIQDFSMSEPEFLLSVMERHEGWCVVVCLVGGGQEINTGEAGIDSWLKAAEKSAVDWKVHASKQMSAKDLYGEKIELDDNIIETPHLHLSTSIRSFRAESLSNFIGELVEGNIDEARRLRSQLQNYPIFLTRNLEEARRWLTSKARGSERYGLVASSNAIRLKSEGIFVKSDIDPTKWFLNDKQDVRSSYALEDVATEFDIQGLELDWVGVCWDSNFYWDGQGWCVRQFKGSKWVSVKDLARAQYIKNSYRVLLTRARQGMVIFMPHGSPKDPTRDPDIYDATFSFLKRILEGE